VESGRRRHGECGDGEGCWVCMYVTLFVFEFGAAEFRVVECGVCMYNQRTYNNYDAPPNSGGSIVADPNNSEEPWICC
jgi:hypothetical protein